MSDIIDERTVKTRKPHQCFGCREVIPTGSTVLRSTIVDGGEIYATYLCDDCVEFNKTLPSDYWMDGCYYEGDLAEAKRQEEWKTEAMME